MQALRAAPHRRRGLSPRRRGFTLVEAIIAVAIGAVVLGGGMYIYSFGTKAFFKTTEHSAFRQEALLVLERVGRDFEQLVVAPGQENPVNGEPSIIYPFVLDNPYDLQYPDPQDPDQSIQVKASDTGISFFRYHHMIYDDADPDAPEGEDSPVGMPKMVARKVEYKVVARADGGYNLLRNDKQINSQALDKVVFHREPPVVTGTQVKGSPNAIVTVTVVPKGGTSGHMGSTNEQVTTAILETLQKNKAVVERTFHLVGYESMYTNLLYRVLQVSRRYLNENNLDYSLASVRSNYQAALDEYVNDQTDRDLLAVVFDDAYNNPDVATQTSAFMLERLTNGVGNNAGKAFAFPKQMFLLEDQAWTDNDPLAYSDPTWLNAEGTVAPPAEELPQNNPNPDPNDPNADPNADPNDPPPAGSDNANDPPPAGSDNANDPPPAGSDNAN